MNEEVLNEIEFLGASSLESLNHQQQILFADEWNDIVTELRIRGKDPVKNLGYAESNMRPTARRIFQVFRHVWDDGFRLALTTEHANDFIHRLNENTIRTNEGRRYSKTSKRKFANALEAYFRINDVEWSPPVTFHDDFPKFDSDPFTLDERELLFTTALEYQKPPTYSNVTPDERLRWMRHISQLEGIPLEQVTREDWESLRRSWKIPSIIATTLDAGWRAAIFGRLETDYVDFEKGEIHIPGEAAVKNRQDWDQVLTKRSVKCLERWWEERSLLSKYDSSDLLWLNRNGNPYNSSTLNDLLANLVEDAGIPVNGRTLTWHSIRHSTGMYIYDRKEDLGIVADSLRHTSLEAARRYAHATPENRRAVLEGIQGGRRP